MTKINKYVGTKVGRLEVLELYVSESRGNKSRYFRCKCDCGNEKFIFFDSIRKGTTKSCGCLKREVDSAKAKAMGDSNVRHGMSRTRIYKIWDGMRARCDNPNTDGFEDYGGRGITYDPRWIDFVNFYEDMKNGYSDTLTLERIDVDGNYFKSNCVWVTHAEQQKNKQNTPFKKKMKQVRKLKAIRRRLDNE
jgi:ribosomal protein S27E